MNVLNEIKQFTLWKKKIVQNDFMDRFVKTKIHNKNVNNVKRTGNNQTEHSVWFYLMPKVPNGNSISLKHYVDRV